MAYTSAQIVALSCQIAKVPGYAVLAGQLLNAMLEELWQTNDFQFSRKTTFIDLTQAQPTLGYSLPSDHERTLDAFYMVNGAPRILTQLPIEQYDSLFQGVSGSSYPEFICVDVSQTPHTILAYPIPPLAAGITVRYLPQQPVIANPETNSTSPWFPSQLYLITRLAAEIMMISDDTRTDSYLKRAEGILSKFMTMGDDDRENYVRQVKLDPRYFRASGGMRATKSMPL
jgi:hypothetical protein